MIGRSVGMGLALLGVAVANVGMNLLLKLSTRDGVRITTAWRSPRVLAALLLGLVSVALLLITHAGPWSFARVMLILAATSLLLGVGLGIARGDRLQWQELMLVLLVLLFYALTWRLRGDRT